MQPGHCWKKPSTTDPDIRKQLSRTANAVRERFEYFMNMFIKMDFYVCKMDI